VDARKQDPNGQTPLEVQCYVLERLSVAKYIEVMIPEFLRLLASVEEARRHNIELTRTHFPNMRFGQNQIELSGRLPEKLEGDLFEAADELVRGREMYWKVVTELCQHVRLPFDALFALGLRVS